MKSIVLLIAVLAIFLSKPGSSEAQSCGDCEIVITFVETWVDANATDQEIASYLDIACSTIFSSEEATCDAIVSQGLGEIIGWLNQNETPEQVCVQLGFCTSTLFKGLSKVASFKTSAIQQTEECSDCESVIGHIENWMNATSNQGEIITTVEIVCTFMPEWESVCDNIIDAGVPDVIQWIEEEENSTVVCGQLGMCGTQQPKKIKQSDCGGCETIIGFIENWALNNATAQEIETYVDAICPFIPDYSQQCTEVIAQEIPVILQYIEQDESPSVICAEIGLCSSSKGSKHVVLN